MIMMRGAGVSLRCRCFARCVDVSMCYHCIPVSYTHLDVYKRQDLDKMWQHLTVKYGEDGGGNTASKAEYKENVFSDTNDVILNHLYQFGIIKGFKDGTYRPDQPISRQDAATVLWLSLIHI